jgi:hypothetical protein
MTAIESLFSSQAEKKEEKKRKNHRKEKIMQRRKGVYFSSLTFALGMKHSSCLLLPLPMFLQCLLSTFLQC